MYTIELEIPDKLGEKLAPYRDQLPELLELGLEVWLERKQQERHAIQEDILQVLAASGKVALPEPYTEDKPYVRRTPVPITGKSVSQIVIEQRGAL